MKVRELQDQLGKLDPALEVVCYTEDPSFHAEGHGFRLLEIEAVDTTQGEWAKNDDGIPSLKLGKGPSSVKLAVLKVTSDF